MPGGYEWLIIIGVLLLLFGAKKLPDMARSVGQSARVFKGEMKGMKDEDKTGDTTSTASTASTPPPGTTPPPGPTPPAGATPPPREIPPAQPPAAAAGGSVTPAAGAAQPEAGRTTDAR